jgi:hypothetical protein
LKFSKTSQPASFLPLQGWPFWLFYAAVAALLIPIWIYPYFPSQDGPSHLFNANVFLTYSQVPAYRRAFTVQIPPAGNLTGHGLAMLLLRAGLAPATCEKVLVSICIVGLAMAFHYALRGAKGAPVEAAFFVLPFLYNWPLQMGFWSFSLGVPFVLICVGLCLRYLGRWDRTSLLKLFLTAAAVYACHPISWAVSALVTGLLTLLWLFGPASDVTDRRRQLIQAALPVATFVPFILPNLLFAEKNDFLKWDTFSSFRERLWPVYTMSDVCLFSGDGWAARALFLLLLAATGIVFLGHIRTRGLRFVDTLLGCAGILILLGVYSPGRIGEGTYLSVRLFLFACLLWALWLALAIPGRRLTITVAALIAGISAWQMLARLPSWRIFDRNLVQFVRISEHIAPGSNICQLDFLPPSHTVAPMLHATDLLLNKKIVDVRDYEAGRKAFWTEFRPGYFLDENYLAPASETDLQGAVKRFERRTGQKIDYISFTNMPAPPDVMLRRVLPTMWKQFRLVAVSRPASVAAVFKRDSG